MYSYEKIVYAIFLLLVVSIAIVITLLLIKHLFKAVQNSRFSRYATGFNREIIINEITALDSKRKVALIQYKNTKYLLLIGGEKDIVVIERFQ